MQRQPLSQIDYNQDNRGATPKNAQFKTNTLHSDYKSNQNYNVQFKVKPQIQEQQNSIIMSPAPLRRNTIQQLVTSPLRKNYSQKHIEIHSPGYRGISQQPRTNHLLTEVQFIKDQNQKLQQDIFKLESQIQRGNSTQFIRELENKIIMLQTLNDKLNQDNSQLLRISDIKGLRKEKEQQQTELLQMQEEYDGLLQKLEQFNCENLQGLDQFNEYTKLQSLVQDLESKVTGLILENEQLNTIYSEFSDLDQEVQQLQLELQSQQIQYQKSKHDEVQYRYKYDSAMHEEKMQKQKLNSQRNTHLDKLNDKIKQLEGENKKLKNLVTDIDYDDEIKELEDRISIIGQNNRKLEHQLLQQE
ncbi:unnamed protein product (macronuclear) [Paramecium tetraurelia]|uniref:Uncharacterized protein n=1 Tax=Paramecium tetraurelia TaxID=5888 RepID=A0EGE0_PARTE|nr:uncharacterized protein GSPATT00026705001 [Paramecium tetraurelia]CAK94381.1 unnamed protein product [Paramecium tetraurelia]|eukprot:XP_001461754.1 hypothetical protein (macronuclear) [Paramecium tetraurelia strain d4-2]